MNKPRKVSAKYLESAPAHVAAIYDTCGKSFDRYTDCYTWERERNGDHQARAMSHNPFHPQGFGQIVSATRGSHLGKLIRWLDLPPDCQRCVIQDGQE